MKRKFDIAYMIAKENMSFTKMKAVCALEERHGADLGEGYKNDRGCSVFVELLFCLPIANGRVERGFSQLKLMKNN